MRNVILLLIFFGLLNVNQFFTNAQSPLEGSIAYIDSPTVQILDTDNNIPGTIGGVINVSPSGAATYSIPLKVFPGSNGMQPGLNIVYSSQSGYGMLGYGWTISGLSAITRANKIPYYDNQYKGVGLDSNDGLALDGVRLVQRSGHLSPANNPYSRIETLSSGYKLITQDGVEIFFGTTTDSRFCPPNSTVPYAWAVSKIVDINGNYIEYKYFQDPITSESVISEINYTGNGTSHLPYNSVRFFYGKRADEGFSYLAGRKITNNKALKRIEVRSEGAEKIEYNFYYTHDLFTKLHKITLNDCGEKVNPTIINWNKSTTVNSEIVNQNYGTATTNKVHFGDFNGDGIIDVAIWQNGTKFVDVRIANSNGTWSNYTIVLPQDEYFNFKDTWVSRTYSILKIEVLDWSGNGSDEIVVEYDAITNIQNNGNVEFSDYGYPPAQTQDDEYYVDRKISHYAFNQNGFSLQNQFSYNVSTNHINYDTWNFHYADLSNDGIINRIVLKNGILHQIERLNAGTLPAVTGINHMVFGDFDGNGRIDFLVFTSSGDSMYEFNGTNVVQKSFPGTSIALDGIPQSMRVGDFNGDGKTDYVTYSSSNGWRLYYSSGSSFILSPLPQRVNYKYELVAVWPCGNRIDCERVFEWQETFSPSATIDVADLNNDGRSDILFGRNDSVYVTLSRGGNFSEISDFIGIRTREPGTYSDVISLQSIDIRNNGQKSILVGLSHGTQSYKFIHFNNRLDIDLLVSSITDGMNNTTSLNYSVYKDNRQFSQSFPKPAFPLMLLRGPFLLTGSIVSTFNNNPTPHSTNYSYEDGYVHIGGLGFLGFKKVIAENAISNTKTTSEFQLTLQSGSNIFYHPWLSNQEVRVNNSLVSSASSVMQPMGGDFDKKLFLAVPVSSQQTDYLRNISTSTINTFNTELGRIVSTVAILGAWKKTNAASYSSVAGYVTKPLSLVETNELSGNTFSRTTVFEYDNSKPLRLVAKTVQGVKETYNDFDQYGNIKSITADATALSLTTTFNYDPKGRYVLSTTDPLGLTEQRNLRLADGRVLTETDPYGEVTQYNYTVNGGVKVITSTSPAGNYTVKTMGWDMGQDGRLFYSREENNLGAYHSAVYNSAGQKLEETSPGFQNEVITTVYRYNNNGTLQSKQTTGFNPVNYLYDDFGRITRTTSGVLLDISVSYSGRTVTTTDHIKGANKTELFDETGNTISVSGTMGSVQYEYHPNGQVKKINSGGIITEMSYDSRGNQTQLNDPSAGISSYSYNNLGQITSQTDAKGQTIQMLYDQSGRLEIKSGPGIYENYSYYNISEHKGLLQSISRNGVTETYYYGNYNRLDSVKIEGASKSFTTSYQYNTYGQIYRVKNPTGLTLQYEYNNLGEVIKIYDVNNLSKPIWEGSAKNQQQQWTEFRLGNDLITKYGYDSNYMLSSVLTGTSGAPNVIQNLTFSFNNKGQLKTRGENNKSESFEYDNLNRLTVSQVYGKDPIEVNYNPLGNITSTSLAGNYGYNAQKPYAVETVSGVPGSGQSNPLQTYSTFTADNKVEVMDNGVFRNEFIYGPSGNRFKVNHYKNNVRQFSKIYLDNNEFILDGTGKIIISRTIITAPTGVCAVYQDSAGVRQMYYIHTDYLGSWLVITNESRQVVTRNSYDAWGRPRDPITWELLEIGILNALMNLNAMQPRFDRGYTGHEHMCGFGLINMNGRLYDPYLQRFLSPDPYVQAPYNAQNYNRYSYVLNNPFMYTDPSGEWIWLVFAAYGAWNMGVRAGLAAERSGGHFWRDGFWKGAMAGAIVGASSFITGGAVVNAFNVGGIFTGAVVGGLTGAAVGGVGGGLSSWAMGGDFWDGAKHGALLGGISGAFSGGFAGYAIAQAKGLNYWWGNEVKDGRNQWSFFTSEKPYYVVKWDVSNVGSKSLNDCVPTSFAEANDYFGGNTSYDDYLTRTGYIDDVGVRLVNDPNRYRDFVSEHFNTIPLGADGLTDERIVRDIKNAGGLIHTNMPYRGIRHADNLRSIKYFRSGKVVMKFRIGSFRFSSGNYNWWFYILTGVK